MTLVGGDGARHGEVLDGGAADAVEGGRTLIIAGNGSGNGMIVAQEGAAERLGIVVTYLPRNINVGIQSYELATIAVAVHHVMCKHIPVGSTADAIGVSLSAGTGKRCLPCYVWQ